MPPESEYSVQDLVDLGGVTPRTIRYYIVQGLLPSPGNAGPGVSAPARLRRRANTAEVDGPSAMLGEDRCNAS